MEFKKILNELVMSRATSKDPKHVKDPNKYPKELIAWDTGITDRGVTGLTSDIYVLTGKEKVGTTDENGYIEFAYDNIKEKSRRKKK